MKAIGNNSLLVMAARTWLVVLGTSAALWAPAAGQRLEIGIHGGASRIWSTRGELRSEPVHRPAVGVFSTFRLSRVLGLRVELNQMFRGVKWTDARFGSETEATLSYAEVPLLVVVHPRRALAGVRPFVTIGPSVSRLLRCRDASRVLVNGQLAGSATSCDFSFVVGSSQPRYVTNAWEFGVNSGIGVTWHTRMLGVISELRYSHGLTSIQPGADPSVHNRRWTVLGGLVLRIGYSP